MKKLIAGMQKVQICVGAGFLLIFLVTVVIQMVCRYAGVAAMWTEDVSMYSFIWAVFMGGAAMVYENRHFAFTSVMETIKGQKAKSILQIIICLVMLFFSVLMIYYGYLSAKQFWNFTWTSIPQFKRGPTWLCLPICGLTSAIYLLSIIADEIAKIGKGGDQ